MLNHPSSLKSFVLYNCLIYWFIMVVSAAVNILIGEAKHRSSFNNSYSPTDHNKLLFFQESCDFESPLKHPSSCLTKTSFSFSAILSILIVTLSIACSLCDIARQRHYLNSNFMLILKRGITNVIYVLQYVTALSSSVCFIVFVYNSRGMFFEIVDGSYVPLVTINPIDSIYNLAVLISIGVMIVFMASVFGVAFFLRMRMRISPISDLVLSSDIEMGTLNNRNRKSVISIDGKKCVILFN